MTSIAILQKKYFSSLDSLDLDLIIAFVTKKSREFILAHPDFILTKNQEIKIEEFIARRINHKPLAYILGEKEFFGYTFKVTPATLIPRPETEQLVENVLQYLSSKNSTDNLVILDIGTGSGNIIISLAKKIFPVWTSSIPIKKSKSLFLYGIDNSIEALAVAKHNAQKNNVIKKIKFLQSDLLNYFLLHPKKIIPLQQYQWIVVANLPYLSQKIYSATSLNVKKFEPRTALYAPQDGLYYYYQLLQQLQQLKKDYALSTISCYLEISPEQKTKIQLFLKKHLPSCTPKFQKDLAGKWRLVFLTI
jgi:release factor glutamine methyltransferase